MLSTTVKAQEADCRRFQLDPDLFDSIYTTSWLEANSTIIVTDPIRGQTVALSPQGQTLTRVEPQPNRPYPVATLAVQDKLIQLDPNYDFHKLDKSLNAFEKIDLSIVDDIDNQILPNPATADHLRVRTLYEFTIAQGNLVAYGSVGYPGSAQGYELGFFECALTEPAITSGPNEVHFFMPLKENDFYKLGHPYLATSQDGSTVFFLVMDLYPTLYSYNIGTKTPSLVKGFPLENQPLPNFATQNRTAQEVFSDIEKLDLVVGLYAQGDFLYALRRQPQGNKTLWTLIPMKLNQAMETVQPFYDKDGRILSMKLPLKAAHVNALPTPSTWYFFEKSSTGRDRKQDITSVLTIPSAWLQKPDDSPLLAPSATKLKCGK